jgi:hypothetical protein
MNGLRLGIRTLGAYLIGNRAAILQIAEARGALWVGLSFVVSAALAREYDGEYLPAKPWLLLVPLLASVAVAALLFVPFRPPVNGASPRPVGGRAFRQLLTLVWMTAPLAWLYAIPWERMLSPASAVQANLTTLGVVACWRVLVIARALSVLTGVQFALALAFVALIADAGLQIAIALIPVPTLNVMGGIEPSAPDRILRDTTFLVQLFGVPLLLVLLVAAVICWQGLRTRIVWRIETDPPGIGQPTPLFAGLAVMSVIGWLGVLPATQREQRLRVQAEQAFSSGIDSGLAFLSSHRQDEFPPQWDPPPRAGFEGQPFRLIDVIERLADGAPAVEWVHGLYLSKFEYSHLSRADGAYALSDEEWSRLERIIRRLPEGSGWSEKYRAQLEHGRRVHPRKPASAPAMVPGGRDHRAAAESASL